MTILCRLITAFLSVNLVAATANSASLSPKQVVHQFYQAYQKTAKSGLPNPADMATLKPFLSRNVIQQIELA